jgi:hypothetical protein
MDSLPQSRPGTADSAKTAARHEDVLCYTVKRSTLPELRAERHPVTGRGSVPDQSAIRKRSNISMLYDSTRGLLQSILRALESGDEDRWDGQSESGQSCLYEMHQMSGSLYTPYKSDRLNVNSRAERDVFGKLTGAIPHVRAMVIAIRHRDQIHAIESGKAALSAMNGTRPPSISGARPEPAAVTSEAVAAVSASRHTRKRRLAVEGPQVLTSAGI